MENKKDSTLEKLVESMKETKSEPGFIRGRALVTPKNKIEVIKKRLCTKIIEFHQKNKKIKREELASLLDINQSTLSFILNYHLDKISTDTLLKCLDKLSSEDMSINDSLKRIALS